MALADIVPSGDRPGGVSQYAKEAAGDEREPKDTHQMVHGLDSENIHDPENTGIGLPIGVRLSTKPPSKQTIRPPKTFVCDDPVCSFYSPLEKVPQWESRVDVFLYEWLRLHSSWDWCCDRGGYGCPWGGPCTTQWKETEHALHCPHFDMDSFPCISRILRARCRLFQLSDSQSPFVDLPNAITFVQAWNYTCQIQALVPRNPLLLSAASAKLRRVSSRERSWTGPLVGLPAGLGVEVSAEVSAEAPVEVPSEVPAEGKVRHHTEPSAEPSAEHSKQIIRGIQVFLRRRERLMGIRNHVLTPFETYFNGYSSPAPPGAYYSANPSPAPSGAYYSANPSPAPSGAYYSANPSPAPSGAYYSANPSPAPSGAYYSANPSPAPIETSIGTLETITELSARAEMAATEFEKLLQERSIVQDLEWSNKGQHVEFEPYESPPLEVVEPIAFSLTARVDKVKCRRIFLARKLLTCNRRLKLADAIVEVEHLQRLRHAHIVQLIGSYIQGRDFAILLYPCANMNLQDFMKPMEWKFLPNRIYALVRFFLCLANGLTYIHAMTTKHMDIKPLNLLVKWRPTKRDSPMNYCIYIADFGISRSFSPIEHSVDEGPISRSKIYCAPEVYNYDKRGRSADVFSLGCVFYEMLTVLSRARLNEFVDHRCGDGEDDSFHANIERVKSWGVKLRAALLQQDFARRGSLGLFIHWLDKMLDADPSARPKATVIAEKLTEFLGRSSCCDEGPEKYVDESVNPPPKFCM